MYTKSVPRKWGKEDIIKLLNYKEQGLNNEQIAEKLNRTEISVQIKLKRLNKKNNTYNIKHIEEKRKINEEYVKYIKPKNILDLYAGNNRFNYDNIKIITNDINKEYNTDYNKDALKLLCELYIEEKKFDIIDLDPFGSCYECLDLAIKMAKKGIIITLGELGHKRWKRLDYVKPRYNINNIEEFTIEKIIKKIQDIGLQNKKQLIIYKYKEWQNIGRVWFEIKPYKITEQWEKNKNGNSI